MPNKHLVMIRHAKSDWDNASIADHDRPLNKRGQRDAPIMADLLHDIIKRPDVLISSTAKRAQETAAHFIKKLKPEETTSTDKLYEAGIDNILDVIHNVPPDASCVLLVGHNPGFTEVVELLSTTPHLNMPTCCVAVLKLHVDTWTDVGPGTATLVSLEVPRDHQR